jgi:protein O-GlcNAc transferase
VPRVITFQRKRANRRIVNEPELLQLLSWYGEVRVVEFNSSTPFAEQLRVMRETGVYVSAHTSNLANAVFLQPGSAVVEIIQVCVGLPAWACVHVGGALPPLLVQ